MGKVRFMEELSMNAWPSLQTKLLDGWVLRFSNGYTKRANSINPIYHSKEDINNKVDHCEQIYRNKNMRVVFKMTNEAFPESLDCILQEKGYEIIDNTSVQTLDLSRFTGVNLSNIIVEEDFSEEWLTNYCLTNSVNERNKETLRDMLRSIGTNKYFASLRVDGKIVAYGLGVLEREHMGLFDIVVDKEYRGRGYGEQMMRGLIKIGKNNGAKIAYLQVMLNNSPALKLYSKIGFKEIYQYWYRVKE
ncbi:GNAT family N-acetyltransferase [Brassicibacter mesophilus]|uniref:GNAT family N-acetyltransferase n=1 Tax=Brassicibacter mesophilus TaxID=745119 RepID=UPI003D25FE58